MLRPLYIIQRRTVIVVVAVVVAVALVVVAVVAAPAHIFLQLFFEKSQLSLYTGSCSRGILRGSVRSSSPEDADRASLLDQVLAQIGFRLFCPANLLSCF